MNPPLYIARRAYEHGRREGAVVTTLTSHRSFDDDIQLIPEAGDWIDAEGVMRSAKRIDELLNGSKGAKAPLLIDVVAQLEKDLPVLLEIAALAETYKLSIDSVRMNSRLKKIKHLLQGD